MTVVTVDDMEVVRPKRSVRSAGARACTRRWSASGATNGTARWVPVSGHGDPQKSRRNLSARVIAKTVSTFAVPSRVTSRFSDTDFTSSHFA